jgi:4-cresol dehydrogenase (hydroxylating) flavoprotein subunit
LRPLPPEALAAWRTALGDEHVVVDPPALQRAGTATFATQAGVAALLRPASTAQVQACLRTATAHGVPVHPVSRGRNWGLGSRVPPVDGAALLDLGRMNRILAFDEDLAFITVEPGVTFRQVHDFLRERGSGLFCAVIGGAAEASLIGNALERGDGVGPLRQRAEHAAAMEVVLANGQRIETGLGRWPGALATPVHRAGLGPGLDGLFLQSSLGVVTRMSFWLAPRPAFLQVFTLEVPEPAALAGALDALRRLGQQGALGEAGFTFWNHIKFIARQRRYTWDAPDAAAALRPAALGVPPWQGSGAHYAASRALGQATRELVLAALQPWAKVAVFDTDTHGPELAASLFMGVPSNQNLASTYWRKRGPVPGPPDSPDPDRDGCGVLFICPVLPLQGALATQVLAQVEALVLRHGLEPNIGMHIDAHHTLLVYIALMYDREAPGEDARALACHDAVLALLLELGHFPFRLALPAQGRLPAPTDDTVAVMSALKTALDQAQVLSPGRYDFSLARTPTYDDQPTQAHD